MRRALHCVATSGAARENTCLALPDIGRRVVGSKRERKERKRERERRARERERDPLGPEKSRPLGLHDPVTNSLSCIQDDTLKVSSAGYRPSERLLSDSVYCVVHRCYSCFCLLLPYLLRSCLRVGGG